VFRENPGQEQHIACSVTNMKDPKLLVWTPEMIRNFWDYESRFPENYFANGRGAEIARRLRPYLPSGHSILDYGCGPGYLIEHLLKLDLQVAGTDTSEESIRRVKEKFGSHPGFINAFSREQLADSGRHFDVVIVLEVIEHLYDDALRGLLDDVRGLLNPGGTIILTTPNDEELEKHYILCPVTNELFHRWQHVRKWSGDDLRHYLENSGFSVDSCFSTNFNLTFHTRGMKHPLMKKWFVLRKKIKHFFKPDRKPPHLVAIAHPK
jgi:2-polyprenyl-3-methyl-5-hydroxy-6-metoxy-1,4-benzoquinol methylase